MAVGIGIEVSESVEVVVGMRVPVAAGEGWAVFVDVNVDSSVGVTGACAPAQAVIMRAVMKIKV